MLLKLTVELVWLGTLKNHPKWQTLAKWKESMPQCCLWLGNHPVCNYVPVKSVPRFLIHMYVLAEKVRVETGAHFEINLDLTHSNEDKEGRIGNPFFSLSFDLCSK